MIRSVYEALLNSNAVIEFDVNGNILWANQKFLQIFGYKLEEIVRKHHSIFFPGNTQNFENFALWNQLTLGKMQTGEFRRLSKTKNEIWIQGSYAPIVDEGGKVIKVIKTAIDITEKKRLAQNLETKNLELMTTAAKAKAAAYAKSVFLANMSHEIRTPLNSIIGITDTLAETKLDKQQSHYVEILQRANNQLMTIINDILDLSKVEAGEVELNNLPFDLRKVLDEVRSLLSFRAQEKGLKLDIHLADNVDVYLNGDATRLRQVLINLVSNAIKFTSVGGVHLSVEKNFTNRSGNILFSIADTGIGISRSKFKDIFRPFTQADPTTTRRYGGTGLGLSISQKIVTMMKGQIWLESEIGRGSNFFFTVNLKPTSEQNVKLRNPMQGQYHLLHANPERGTQPLNILIVDDVEDNRRLLGIYLQKTAHRITYASSGHEALTKVALQPFDIIFMDVQMPEMDGYEATKKVRSLEKELNRSPSNIFACTANAFSEDITKSHQAGCDMHLSKPLRKDTLIRLINALAREPDVVC